MNKISERLRARTTPVMGGAGLYEVVLDERPDALCVEAADALDMLEEAGRELVSACEGLEWNSFTESGWKCVKAMRAALANIRKGQEP